MESLSPTHPNLENVTISTQETKPATSAPAPESPISHPISSSNPAARTTFPTMHPVASPSLHSQPSTTSPVLHYYQPYTPSQEEIQSHPIVQQRLSVPRDEVTTGFGTAIAPPASVEVFEECWSSAADPRLAHITRAPVAMAETQVKEGDQVSYPWGGGRPGGEVAEVAEEGAVQMETNRGNVVSKNAEPDNPAVRIEREGHDVVKKGSEIAVDEAGDKHKEAPDVEKTVTSEDKKENGEAQTGDKRTASATPAEEKKSGDAAGKGKKQKTEEMNGEKPKKKGRPAKGANGAKKEGKKRAPKKAATESGEPRRSGRVASKSE